MNWVKFWFEGNQCWGYISSEKDWEKIKEKYTIEELKRAKKAESIIPYFGFSRECKGKETLGDFFATNKMEM